MAGIITIASFLVVECEVEGTAVPVTTDTPSSSPIAAIRQTDSHGRPLPFRTEFPNRWSRNNDGSDYEPCTEVADSIIESLGGDPSTVTDVAIADFQTARGCQWLLGPASTPSISQSVGNSSSISEHKAELARIVDWLPDELINNRSVAVGSIGEGECSTLVQSGRAHVVTSYSDLTEAPPPLPTLCAKALEFTRATIDKMPP
ncbi:DUF3558 family protein [Gordonia sp. NPDC003376]